jgi:Ca2+-binding EF-hand superfamily protein
MKFVLPVSATLGLVCLFPAIALCADGSTTSIVAVRYVAVSPLGEVLGASTGEVEQYRLDMGSWFSRADTDHDGKVSPAELSADADRVFTIYDITGDGVIVSAELTYYRMTSPFTSASIDPVRVADSDANSQVTPDEFRAQALRRHAAMDTNGDGAIAIAEFMDQVEGPLRAWTLQ